MSADRPPPLTLEGSADFALHPEEKDMTPEQHLQAALCPGGAKKSLNIDWAKLVQLLIQILPVIAPFLQPGPAPTPPPNVP